MSGPRYKPRPREEASHYKMMRTLRDAGRLEYPVTFTCWHLKQQRNAAKQRARGGSRTEVKKLVWGIADGTVELGAGNLQRLNDALEFFGAK